MFEFSTSQIDQKIKDLLVREAHLRMSREQLRPVWVQKEVDLRTVQASKPTFLLIMGARAKAAYAARLAAAQETATIFRNGLEVIERCEPHIRKMIEDEIENVLRTQCVE